MRRFIILIFMLLSFGGLYAQSSADAILKDVLLNIESCNPYKVVIEVNYAGNNISGFYEVDKDSYYISIDQQELYGNTSEKYEVFNGRKEIVIDSVKPDYNGNILNNPATAFSAIKDHYSATIISEDDSYTLLELNPLESDKNSIETIELTVSNLSMLPTEVVYKFGDDKVVIKVVEITNLQSTITSYNAYKYVDYEIIDFR